MFIGIGMEELRTEVEKKETNKGGHRGVEN